MVDVFRLCVVVVAVEQHQCARRIHGASSGQSVRFIDVTYEVDIILSGEGSCPERGQFIRQVGRHV